MNKFEIQAQVRDCGEGGRGELLEGCRESLDLRDGESGSGNGSDAADADADGAGDHEPTDADGGAGREDDGDAGVV